MPIQVSWGCGWETLVGDGNRVCDASGLCPHASLLPGKSSSKRRSSDIISLLVSIYGSKDLFINEYRTLLADRLLHQFNYSAER